MPRSPMLPLAGIFMGSIGVATGYVAIKYPALPFKNRHCVGMKVARVADGGPRVAVYYPAADKGGNRERRGYFRKELLDVMERRRGDKYFPSFLLSYLTWESPYFSDAAVRQRPAAQKYPVVVFSHGLMGTLEMYSSLCAGVADAGYIVVAMEHEDGSALSAWREDGSEVANRTPPAGFEYNKKNVEEFRRPFLETRLRETLCTTRAALGLHVSQAEEGLRVETLRGTATEEVPLAAVLKHADVSQLYLMGHSFGGATVVYGAQELGKLDRRVATALKGTVVLDLWPYPLSEKSLDTGIQGPCLFLNSEVFAKNSEMQYTRRLIRASSTASGGRASAYSINGIAHQQFSDTPYFLPQMLGKKMHFCGDTDRNVSYALVLDAILRLLRGNNGSGSTAGVADREFVEAEAAPEVEGLLVRME